MNILDIERNLSHASFYFQGTYVYPLIKQELLLSRLSEHREQFPREAAKTRAKIRTVLSVLRNAIRLSSQARLKHYDYLFVDSASSRRYFKEGISYSIYCDFIMEKLAPKKSLLLELPSDRSVRYSGIATQDIYYPDLDFIWIFIKSLFARRRFEETEIMKAELDRFGVQVHKKELNRLLKRFRLYSQWADRILRLSNPEYLFMVSPYSYIRMALVKMCKLRGIPVIELQHGQVSRQHYGYIYKHLENRDLIPDYFFAYGQYYSDLLKEHSVIYKSGSIFNTGNLFLEENPQLDTGVYSELVKEAGARKILLISSQTTTRNEMKEVAGFLVESLPEELFVIYKPHPMESDPPEYYADLKAYPNFYLVESPELNSLDLLRISDLHMTVYSTVFMEAYYFKVPTLFYHMEALSENIIEFVDDTFYFLVRSREELLKTLESLLSKQEKEAPGKGKIGFYQSDPWGSFCTAMKAIEGS
ncbi:MAG: hypothetical protein E4H10_10070 [Bacteroidia bacterium]|nr:MAG: hypothetical protein E4H10_10070 [Bacteroidia bacterium]